MLVVSEAMSRRGGVVVDDDVLYRFRLRLFSLAEELHNVRAACRIFGVHPSTYYRWRPAVLASGLEMLRPRERRPPRMPNQLSQLTEQRIVAFSLGLAAVLIGIGILMVTAGGWMQRWSGEGRVIRLLPAVSGAAILILGFVIAVQSLVSGHVIRFGGGPETFV